MTDNPIWRGQIKPLCLNTMTGQRTEKEIRDMVKAAAKLPRLPDEKVAEIMKRLSLS